MNKLELSQSEMSATKELIYNHIDRIGGYEELSPELKSTLTKINKIIRTW